MDHHFCSFIVVAPDEVPLSDYGVYLDRGRNVFNVGVDDVEKFKTRLIECGVRIVQVNVLDEFEPPESVPELTPHDHPSSVPPGEGP